MTVIIPTLASSERSVSLVRAVESIHEQEGLCKIIVVVNGNRRDLDVVSALKRARDTRVLELVEGDLVKALTAGVEAVTTPYFSILDDDDHLMAGAARKRIDYMDRHPEADVLVTPGQRQFMDGRTVRVPHLNGKDTIASLLDNNWLASCGGVFRRRSVGHDYFASMPRYLEWTYLAFQLARERSVHFMMDDPFPHFTIVETPSSESRSLEYSLAMPGALAQMQDPSLPLEIQRTLSRKVGAALHHAAGRCKKSGRMRDAWRFHLASLRKRDGMKYLLFTRHLLIGTLRLTRDKRGLDPVE